MVFEMVSETLGDLMQMLKTKKQDESLDAEQKRHVAVAYTEMEKLQAYIQTYLMESEK